MNPFIKSILVDGGSIPSVLLRLLLPGLRQVIQLCFCSILNIVPGVTCQQLLDNLPCHWMTPKFRLYTNYVCMWYYHVTWSCTTRFRTYFALHKHEGGLECVSTESRNQSKVIDRIVIFKYSFRSSVRPKPLFWWIRNFLGNAKPIGLA